jgi:hypothetical protein
MNYQKEFPDYPVADMPLTGLQRLERCMGAGPQTLLGPLPVLFLKP